MPGAMAAIATTATGIRGKRGRSISGRGFLWQS